MSILEADRGLVRTWHGATWPHRCVVCNAAGGLRVTEVVRFSQPGAFLIGAAGRFLDQTHPITYTLCPVHHEARRRGAWLMAAPIVAMVVWLLLLRLYPSGLVTCGACVVPPMLPILFILGRRRRFPIRGVRASEGNIWTTAGEPFVRSLPEGEPWR